MRLTLRGTPRALGRRVRRLRPPDLRRTVPGRRSLVAALVLTLVAGTVVAGLLRLRADTGPDSFLPAGDPALEALTETARSFGGDPLVVLAESAQPRRLLDAEQLPNLVKLEGELAALPDVAVVYGPGTVLNQLAGAGRNLIATLAGRRDAVVAEARARAEADGEGPEAVQAAGEGAAGEFDRRYVGLLVRGLPAGLPTLRNGNFVSAVAFEAGGAPRPQWRFVIPSPEAVAILVRPREGLDQAGTERLSAAVSDAVAAAGLDTVRTTVTGTPALAAALGEQVRQEIPLLGGIAVGLIAACYLLVPWLPGARRSRLLPLAATLGATAVVLAAFGWLGRPLTLGVVAFLPILVGVGSDFPAYLTRGASARRVLVTALAAAAGFASLAISSVPSIRELGLALAAGVLVAVGIAVVLQRLRRTEVVEAENGESPVPPRWAARPTWRRMVLLGVVGAVAASGWALLPRLDVEARPDQLAAGLPAVDDAEHAEQMLGSAGEVRVVLHGPDVYTPEALDWMNRAQQRIVVGHGDEMRPIVGLPGLFAFLGDSPTAPQIAAARALMPDYLTAAVARLDGTEAAMSFGVGLGDLASQDDLFNQVRAELPEPPDGYEAEVVGLPVAVAEGYRIVFDDRHLGNLVGIAAAAVVLLIGLRRRFDAVRAVLAALLATGFSLAVSWVLGIPLTPLTAALGSLTVATACEFTVVLASVRGRVLARTVAAAAAAAALGYAALAMSGLAVLRQFGLLLAATVVLSLVAAKLVVTLLPDASDPPAALAPRTEPAPEEVTV
ncbi:RND transporter [Pseudonocardia sp. RS010]|uniref:RND transporter n=1 Tax=Pseudonocardia sp. RS010 TaxID=3385979 RepID=UPI0039A0709B